MAKKVRRRKGFGSLEKRGRYWYARWTERGVAHHESTGVVVGEEGSKERALAVLMEKTKYVRLASKEDRLVLLEHEIRMTRAERLAANIERARGKKCAKDLWDAFVESPRRKDITEGQMPRYKAWITSFVNWYGGDNPVENIGWNVAEDYAKKLQGEGSPNTYNKNLNALEMLWKAVGRSLGMEGNPWSEIPRKKLDTHVRRAFTKDETDMFLARSKGDLHKLIAIGIYTGLRLGDACCLDWSDFHDGNVYVLTTKTGAKVSIPVHPRLEEAIGKSGTGPVVPVYKEMYLKCKAAPSAEVTEFMKGCGIVTSVKAKNGRGSRPEAGFHSFRHTFASRAIEAGVKLEFVQALLGHTTAAMTEHYTHISDTTILEAFRKMM